MLSESSVEVRRSSLEVDMALITLRQLLDHAAEFDYGVPAFNVNNLEQVRAIMGAAAHGHHECVSPGRSLASGG
jgi:fructose-bisphosphate aldolase class II